MERKDFVGCFEILDEHNKALALDTLDEYIYFQAEIKKLQKLPLIRYDERNPERQQITPAGKLIKEYSQVVDAKRGTLLRILNRVEVSEADALAEMLKEFE